MRCPLAQRLGLDLPDALAGDAELVPHLLQRVIRVLPMRKRILSTRSSPASLRSATRLKKKGVPGGNRAGTPFLLPGSIEAAPGRNPLHRQHHEGAEADDCRYRDQQDLRGRGGNRDPAGAGHDCRRITLVRVAGQPR